MFTLGNLNKQAEGLGKDPVKIERAYYLLQILEGLQGNPKTRDKFSLRGGTAFNLFRSNIPRVSQDIDINYTAQADNEACRLDMPVTNQGINEVLLKLGFTEIKQPEGREHEWSMQYGSLLGGTQKLTIDINYFNRVPIFKQAEATSVDICGFSAKFPVLNNYDLVAGKFNALFTRGQVAARDIYDIYRIVKMKLVELDDPLFRVALMVEVACHSPLFILKKPPGNYKKGKTVPQVKTSIDTLNYGNFMREMQDTLSTPAYEELFGGGGAPQAKFKEVQAIIRDICEKLLRFSLPEKGFVEQLYGGHVKPGYILHDVPDDLKADLTERLGKNSYLHHIARLSARIKLKEDDEKALNNPATLDEVHDNPLPSLERFASGKPVDVGHPMQRRAKDLLDDDIVITKDDINLIKKAARRYMLKDHNIDRDEATDMAIRNLYVLRDLAKKRGGGRAD